MFLQIYKNINFVMHKQVHSRKYDLKFFSVVETCKFKFSLKILVQDGVFFSCNLTLYLSQHVHRIIVIKFMWN